MSYGQQPGGYGYGGPPHYPPPGPPGFHGPPQGPRNHPSANAVLALGLASVFCLGAIAGVPAILLGRKVLADAAREPGRWVNASSARVGVVFGWISVAGTAFLVARAATHGWAVSILGILVAVVGLTFLALGGIKSLPAPVGAVGAAMRRAPLAIGLTLGGALLGSVSGLAGTVGASQQAALRCTQARSAYANSGNGKDFRAMRTAIGGIETDCGSSATAAEITTMRAEVSTKEAAEKKRADEEERARQVREAAEKEKNAVETFPDASKAIATMLTAAQSKVWQGKVEAADADYDGAQAKLDGFKGTSVEESKGFNDLGAQIGEKKKAIQPQVERSKEARRKVEAAADEKRRKEAAAAEERQRKEDALAALKAAIRGPKPTNSAWDGSVHAVERHLKQALHDPGSYDHVRTSPVTGEGDYWVVVSSFRGKNAFGALIITTKKFYIQGGEVVKVADVGGDD